MDHSDKPFGHALGKAGLACSWMLAIFAGLALSMNFALAQEDDAEEEDEEALELRDVRVTGSRLNRPPSELSGNLIVLDREAIRASGELTLARVLRQLPQNVNATNETYGSRVNGAQNRTGAATVNLRGLGSESTLILVDGRRIGYSGILGGVTDISTIPLSMVDRIEILLDGASAVYGSDAVGGVVNIITRQDYSGIELDLNYARPHKSGFDEQRANLSAGWSWNGGRANVGYEYFRDSGLDSSQRESVTAANRSTLLTTRQKNTAPGPQIRVSSYFYDESCPPPPSRFNPLSQLPILWDLANGDRVTHAEYLALDPGSQEGATCRSDITLPLGFMPGDDFSTIDYFGEPHWGDEAELGVSLRPFQNYDVVNMGIDQEISPSVRLHANIRYGQKESGSNDGQNQVSGVLNANNPHNPFGVQVDLSGLSTDTPPKTYDSETEELFVGVGAEGEIGNWSWEVEYSSSKQEIDTQRFNVRDPGYFAGVNSDGVTGQRLRIYYGAADASDAACEARRVELGGGSYVVGVDNFGRPTCQVYGAPPVPINPFASISEYIIADVNAGSTNEQAQFEALARGTLFNAPGGPVTAVVGYDFREDVLDSFSELSSGLLSTSPATYAGAGAPVSGVFNTRISRDNHAGFMEGWIPLVGSNNSMPGVQRLSFTVSGRYDSYSNAEVDYRATATGEAGTLKAADPGSEFTWGGGLVYRPTDEILLKANVSTSFVAPQLNQLLSRETNARRGFFFIYVPGGGGAIRPIFGNVFTIGGGNEHLTPETAENIGVSAEFSPSFLPGLFFKAAWSDTEFSNRIAKLSVPIVDIDNLPSNVQYDSELDIFTLDDRWVNVSSVDRSGIDYELRYEWEMGLNDYSIVVRRSYTNQYRLQADPASEVVHNLVTSRDDTGPEDSVLPAVPKHQTSMQFTWIRGGLFLSVDVQGADTTKLLNATNRHYITEPATNYDLVLGYEFGSDTFFDAPAWTNGLDVTITINNLTNAFADTSNFNPETGEREHFLVNPFYEWTQGRSYRLAIHKSF